MKLQPTAVVFLVWILGILIAAPLRADEASQKAARSAAEAWLGLVDAEKYGESWDEAASFFKSKVSKNEWTEMVGSAREPLWSTEIPTLPGSEIRD